VREVAGLLEVPVTTNPASTAQASSFLNAAGTIAAIAEQAALDDNPTAHVLRHTFATSLVRGKTDLVVVAELMGHSRLDTTRQCSLPTNKTNRNDAPGCAEPAEMGVLSRHGRLVSAARPGRPG
jgi:integrase